MLRALPVQWGLLKQSGVAATVRQRAAEHPNRAVRAAVAAVTQHWATAIGDASLATAPPQTAAVASAVPARRDALTPSPSEEAAEVLDEGVRLRLAEADAVRHGLDAHQLLLSCCPGTPHMLQGLSSWLNTAVHLEGCRLHLICLCSACLWLMRSRCTCSVQKVRDVSASMYSKAVTANICFSVGSAGGGDAEGAGGACGGGCGGGRGHH